MSDERVYGLTDNMHGFVGGMMSFSFLGSFIFYIGVNVFSIPILSYSTIGLSVILIVLAILLLKNFMCAVANERIESSRYLFTEEDNIKKIDFIELPEAILSLLLLSFCIMSGELFAMFIQVLLCPNIIAIAYLGMTLLILVFIPITHSEMGMIIHRNDLSGVKHIRKQKKIYEARQILKEKTITK